MKLSHVTRLRDMLAIPHCCSSPLDRSLINSHFEPTSLSTRLTVYDEQHLPASQMPGQELILPDAAMDARPT